MSRDIIDAAVMQQFKEYLVKKGAYLLDSGSNDKNMVNQNFTLYLLNRRDRKIVRSSSPTGY